MTSYDGKTKNKSNLNRFIYMFSEEEEEEQNNE